MKDSMNTVDIKFLSLYWRLWFSDIKLYGETPDFLRHTCMEDYLTSTCRPAAHKTALEWLSA